MDIQGKNIVITGGASGIGLALAKRFIQEGAQVTIADLHVDPGQAAAQSVGAAFRQADVSREENVKALIEDVLAERGHIDLFCSNAGTAVLGGPEVPQEQWDQVMNVNLGSHIWAARHLLPHFLARGQGYFLNTASAAGLLSESYSAPYATSKHAAVGFAEWLAFTYGDRGIKVTVICPEGVHTPMIANAPILIPTAITAEEVAEKTLEVVKKDGFMVITHPTTTPVWQFKATNPDAWIGKMAERRTAAMALLEPQS